jgi:signal transduction histidine kinase
MPLETDAEVLRLRAVLRDLVALSAIPAAWIGGDPPAVVAGLADSLVGLLQLDFAFVRLSDPGGAGAVEATRGSAWATFPEWLNGRIASSGPLLRREVVPDVGDDSTRRCGVAVPVGVNGEGGLVAAAAERSDFPTPMEQLLLTVAANHAAAAFQSARLIHERKQAEDGLREARNQLEAKVAERTEALHAANDELAALRRVATLVAEGVRPLDLFAEVAEQIARVINVPRVSVVRYEPDGTGTQCATFSSEGSAFPVGYRWSLEGTNVLQLVKASAAPARIDDYSQLEGEVAVAVRRRGIRSSVGIPIVVAGRVWGTMNVSTSAPDPLPEGTEGRLADFTELLATAIENAESRETLERVAAEQAALRRVATLVAQGVQPGEIFSAVSEEVGQLFGAHAVVLRYESDGPAVVWVGMGKSLEGRIPVGTRWELDGAMASAEVYRTGRPARVEAIDWSSRRGPFAEAARRAGLVSTVAGPIVVEGRLWGAVTVLSKDERLPLGLEDRLEKFTELAATAIANAESRSQLAASRRRIVAASDEARSRIERDLHDGTQQRLVTLGLTVRSLEARLPAERSDLRVELARLATGLTEAFEELQELSRGIHPGILSQGGLGPALRVLAHRSVVPVELDVATEEPLPKPIEVVAYFVVSEALANATKHAQASRVEVSLAPRNGSLLLSIRDDGVGGADPARGSGLVGLTDRVEALGGSIEVRSTPGKGTHITAELPLELEVGREPEQPSPAH